MLHWFLKYLIHYLLCKWPKYLNTAEHLCIYLLFIYNSAVQLSLQNTAWRFPVGTFISCYRDVEHHTSNCGSQPTHHHSMITNTTQIFCIQKHSNYHFYPRWSECSSTTMPLQFCKGHYMDIETTLQRLLYLK